MKNVRSFWSWQGNNLEWWPYTKWVVYGLIIVLLILIFIFKDKIKHNHITNKRGIMNLYFKSYDTFYRVIGWVIIAAQFLKLLLYLLGGYPLYWEHLMFHICRIHMFAIGILLILNKKELLKYITYISILGALLAIQFGEISWNTVNGIKKELFEKHNIQFYGAGADNFFYYDFFLLHIMIIVIPVYLWTAYSWKLETHKLYRSILFYWAGILFMWLTNWLSIYIPDKEWWSNNWYIGRNEVNFYHNALGYLSSWPGNLIFITLLGTAVSHLFHLVWIGQTYIKYKNFRLVRIESITWTTFRDSYNKKLIYNIFHKEKQEV